MKLIKRVNLLDDKKLIMKLNILTIPLLVIFFALFTLLTLDRKLSEEVTIDLMYLVIAILSMAGLIIFHELIHGIFFKLFNKEGKVKFGFKNGLAYATSPNSFYSRWQFLLILLAPFVLITVILWLLYAYREISPYAFVWLASFHGSACIGDFYFCYLVTKAPAHSYVEDTEQGINFYSNH